MSNRRRFFLIFLFILLDMFLLIGYLVIRDATMLNRLKKEVYELSQLDITKDRYNRKNVTYGEYAVVESTIKEYLDDYAVSLQEVMNVMQEEKFIRLLSYENYQTDGPEFTNSFLYLVKTKRSFNSNMDYLLSNIEEENILKRIYNKTSNDYYQKLYQELMLSDSMKDDFSSTRDTLYQTRDKVNSVIDQCEALLTFLKINQEAWVLEEGEIRFQTQDLYNQYNAYILKIKEN